MNILKNITNYIKNDIVGNFYQTGALNEAEEKAITPGSFGLTSTQFLIWSQNLGGNPYKAYRSLWVVGFVLDNIAKNVATLPRDLINVSSGEIVLENDVSNLFKHPNPIDTEFDIMYQWTLHYLINGNGYIWDINRRNTTVTNRFSELHVLLSQNVEPIPIKGDKILIYENYQDNIVYQRDEIIHIKLYDPQNRWVGMSSLQSVLQEIEYSANVNRFKNALLKNQATPSGALETDQPLYDSDFEKLKSRIIDSSAGVANAGKVIVLDNGLKWKQLALNPKDLTLNEAQNQTDSYIATRLGMPIELVGNLANQKNYSNYIEASRAYYRDTLIPIGQLEDAALSNFFFPEGDFVFRINENKIKVFNLSTTELGESWWLTPNERRNMQNQSPIEDDENMDKIWIPAGNMPIDVAGMAQDGNNL